MSPHPTMPINEQYLSGAYHQRNPTFHVEDSAWKARQIERMLDEHHLIPTLVAEVGSGAGAILADLARHYPAAEFDGYELSPQGHALAQARASDRVHFFNADFGEIAAQVYDLVLVIDVVEHVEDYLGFLRRLRSHGRAFIFHFPLDMNAQMVLRSSPILAVRASVGHLHYFSKDTALATLTDAGYRVSAWCYTASAIDRPSSWKARLLKLPRRLCFQMNEDLTARALGGYSLMVYALPSERLDRQPT